MTARSSAPAIWLRPVRAAVGRPPRRSRADITAAAISVADREGLEAVSMRRVAAELSTGAASLYRYLDGRDDLLDLMSDATGAEYSLNAPTGDWLADLVEIGIQARAIMRRHPWLADLVPRRPALGPNGLSLLQHFLEVLQPHAAGNAAKLEAFGMLMAVTAVYVQAERAGSAASQQRNADFLSYALSSGEWPRLSELLAEPPAAPIHSDGFAEVIGRIVSGLLGPDHG